jgi:CHAD domain-containing protein
MPFDRKRCGLIFQKLGRELGKVLNKPAPNSVHKFRTYSRRVEAVLSELTPELHRNESKLLKSLARLRKKAGRVRDLDVQIAALRELKFPQGNGHKSQLVDELIQKRGERERKLIKAFNRETVTEIRRRLKKAAREITIPANSDPLALALQNLSELARDNSPLTEKTLHHYRIVGKRARYIAELSDADPEAKRVVSELKQMQDVIGDWHDWLKLTQEAERLLGRVHNSALVAMLRNVTQAKFRESLTAVARLRAVFSQPARPASSKPPAKASAQRAAA